MEFLIGIVLALVVSFFARSVGFDRDRAFYPTVLIVIASYYVLFAAMAAPRLVLLPESLIAGGFLLFGVMGFRMNLWLVVAALVGHAAFDLIHHRFIDNPGVPPWWPGFCITFRRYLGSCFGAVLVDALELGATAEAVIATRLIRSLRRE